MSQMVCRTMLMTLVLVMCLPASAPAEVNAIAWTPSEMELMSTARTQQAAARECILWLLGGGTSSTSSILPRDVFDCWAQEIEAKCLSDTSRYVIQAAPRAEGIYVKLNLVQLIRDLVSVMFGDMTPRLAVVTQEYILRLPQPPDPALETEVLRSFLAYGFQMADIDAATRSRLREVMLQTADGDTRDASVKIDAAIPADILITGEAFAEEAPGGAFVARVELKVIAVQTGAVLAAFADPHQTVRGRTPNVAAKEAIQRGAYVSAPRLVRAMLTAFGKPISKIEINGVRGISDVTAVRQALLQGLPGSAVRVVSSEMRGQMNAVLEVNSKADAMEIAMVLEGVAAPRVLVDEIGCRYVVAKLR